MARNLEASLKTMAEAQEEKFINGELHYQVAAGVWRPYRGEELAERVRTLNDDNPAPCLRDDDK